MLQLSGLASIFWMDALSGKKKQASFDPECHVE
jgi:hypothetical protein